MTQNAVETRPVAEAEGESDAMPWRAEFLNFLFRALDERQVRYCVLHGYQNLPHDLPSDLDLAVDQRDLAKLARAFGDMRAMGYEPAQYVEYAVQAFRIDFVWFDGLDLVGALVDITYGYLDKGLPFTTGEMLVAGRRRHGNFWIPLPSVEFAYLLAKKISKASLPLHQARRLQELATELGRSEGEAVIGRLLGARWKAAAYEACLDGTLVELLPRLRRAMRFHAVARGPVRILSYLAADARRYARRWLAPAGLFVVMLGPDGAGKSTVIDRLTASSALLFRSHRVFHWRPMLISPKQRPGPVTDPYEKPPRGVLASVAHLAAFFLDDWLGYWLLVRTQTASAELAVFDRYFHDLLIDPRRYRYGGPLGLVRALGRLLVKPDLILVFDAPEEVILARKKEVTDGELRLQRQGYLDAAKQFPNAHVIDSSLPVEESAAEATRILVERMAARLIERHPAAVTGGAHSGSTIRGSREDGRLHE